MLSQHQPVGNGDTIRYERVRLCECHSLTHISMDHNLIPRARRLPIGLSSSTAAGRSGLGSSLDVLQDDRPARRPASDCQIRHGQGA